MAPRIPPLPLRPLEVRGHGVYDPVRQAFYPFKDSTSTVTAKRGVRYYVRTCHISMLVEGMSVRGTARWSITQDGSAQSIGWARNPATTALTDFLAQNVSFDVDLLTDSNTELTLTSGGTSTFGQIVYAEIPDDPAGDL